MKPERSLTWKLAGLLAVITFAAFWPVHSGQFINVDDPDYVLQNPHVLSGLTWPGVAWAFGHSYACNWHPITWLSHMLDCNLFGLSPAGPHLVSLGFHAINAMLVFIFLRGLTGAVWRSVLVAAFFALHPLRVESVAWVAERKDVLSGFFALLTLIFYTAYRKVCSHEQSVTAASQNIRRQRRVWYVLTFLGLALGLMSKPMLVTLPFVFLLLDFWAPNSDGSDGPIEGHKKIHARLVHEKIPFFAVSISTSIITFLAQKQGGAVSSMGTVPFSLRLGNAFLSYFQYLGKTLVPIRLSPVYPLANELPLLLVILSVVVLLAITCGCALSVKRNPGMLIGWLWFAGMLVPAIGIIQVGRQAMADRYTYLPTIGLLIAIIWGLDEFFQRIAAKRSLIAVAAGAALITCCLSTWAQARYWRDSVALYGRAFELCPTNYLACDYLGNALHSAGREEDALVLLRESIRLQPHYPQVRYNLGTLLLERGEIPEAIKHLEIAIRLDPDNWSAQQNLGNALLKGGQIDRACAVLEQAVQLHPDDFAAYMNLGAAKMANSEWPVAAFLYSKALKLSPRNADAEHSLALALVKQGATKDAIGHFARAAELRPTDASMYFDLGLACMENKQPDAAVRQFRKSLSLRDNVWAHYQLARALAQLHEPDGAITHYREVLKQSPDFAEARNALADLLPGSGSGN
jgi:tetratricopeptide (TPR) repeat protein